MKCRSLIFIPVVFMFGCSYFHNRIEPERLENGLTLVLPGIEGPSLLNSNIAQGLVDSDFEAAIEVHDWTTGWMINLIYHLQSYRRNLKEAELLVEKIIDYQDRYPDRPVNLIGHSGGGGVILLALDSLPEDRTVSNVVLLAPAISRRFDLSTALDRVEGGIWNFYSYGDAFVLILGTTVAGTIDRKFASSAGAKGFIVPAEISQSDEQKYQDKLLQVPYNIGMLKTGHLGGHFGMTNRRFIRKYLFPLLETNNGSGISPIR